MALLLAVNPSNGQAKTNTIDGCGRPRMDRIRGDPDQTRRLLVHEQLSNCRRHDTTARRAHLQSRGRSIPRADARRLLVSRLERRRRGRRADAESGRALGKPDGRRDAAAHGQLRNRLRPVRDRSETRRPGRDRGAGRCCSAASPTCGSARSWASARPGATRARAASSCCCRRITRAPCPMATWRPSRRPTAWCSACAAFNPPAAPHSGRR